jgi:hypothetical protein
MRGKGLDMAMAIGMQTRAFTGKIGVEFAAVIQLPTARG